MATKITDYSTVGKTAETLGLCKPTVTKLFDRGELTGRIIGGPHRKWRQISKASIKRYQQASA